MHILCPHCRNPIEVVKLSPREEIVCPSCGSSFHLEGESTTGWKPTDGQKIGKFELIDTVGTGAFGTVYKARDPELDRVVAIKVPRAGNLAGPQELDRFLREARSVAQLRHPGIVPVFEVGQAASPLPLGGEGSGVRGSGSIPYLVSEFVAGVTLSDLLTSPSRRPSFRESAQLLAEVADALQYAHSMGVVHRDVKPSNIMLEETRGHGDAETRGEEEDRSVPASPRPRVSASSSSAFSAVKLMDFGLAKRDAGEITMTVDGQVLGTPAYMSPEQARGEAHKVDGRSDVYSVGVILYHLLTGELPFRGNTRMLLHQVLHDEPRRPRGLNDRIPRDLETICLKAMAKEPSRRYATARDFADDLRRWLKGEPILARPVGRVERLRRWCQRNPVVAGLTAAVFLVLCSGLGGMTLLWLQSDAQRQRAEQQKDRAERHLRLLANAIAPLDIESDDKTWYQLLNNYVYVEEAEDTEQAMLQRIQDTEQAIRDLPAKLSANLRLPTMLAMHYLKYALKVSENTPVDDGIPWCDRAVRILQSEIQKRGGLSSPEEAALSVAFSVRARSLFDLERYQEAAKDYEEALQGEPYNLTTREWYFYEPRLHTEYLGLLLLQLKDYVHAATEADKIASAQNMPADKIYDAGQGLAHVSQGMTDKRQADRFAKLAIKLLRRAVAQGYDPASATKRLDGRDFDSLRPREDFRKLLADLEARVKVEKP